MALRLCAPAPCHEGAVLDYLQEHAAAGEYRVTGSLLLARQPSYGHWLTFLETLQQRPVRGQVQLALDEEERLVGLLCCYESDEPRLLRQGGELAYGVRPSRRGQGLATQLVSLALAALRTQGVQQLLVACSQENAASQRVLEKNGGSLAWSFTNPVTNEPCHMYRLFPQQKK